MKSAFLLVGSILGWMAVGLQFYLIILNRVTSVPETIIRFFSFFTILTNILVAICLTVLFTTPKSALGKFFSKPKTLAAITVYITIVGMVYNLVLRYTWNPVGLQRLVDEALHTVIPMWFVLFWLIAVPKTELQWKNTFYWLVYPLAYVLFILLRGSLSEFYPYPFIDVDILGYPKVFINSLLLFLAFLVVSLFLVALGKMGSKQNK